METAFSDATNGDLVWRYARDRDAGVFAELVRRFGPMVRGLAVRGTRTAEDAEDVVQVAFAELAARAGTIEDPEAVGGWLHTVTRRACARLLRRPASTPLSGEPMSDGDDVLGLVAGRADADALSEELDRLPAAWREPLLLRYFSGCSNEESALRLGLTEKAVEGRLKRGRSTLRVRLLRRGVGMAGVLAMVRPEPASAAVWEATADASRELAAAPDTGELWPQPAAATPVATGRWVAAAAAVMALASLSGGGRPAGPQAVGVLDTLAHAAERPAALPLLADLNQPSVFNREDGDRPRRVNVVMQNAKLAAVAEQLQRMLGQPFAVDERSFREAGDMPPRVTANLLNVAADEVPRRVVALTGGVTLLPRDGGWVFARREGVPVADAAGEDYDFFAGGPPPERDDDSTLTAASTAAPPRGRVAVHVRKDRPRGGNGSFVWWRGVRESSPTASGQVAADGRSAPGDQSGNDAIVRGGRPTGF